MDKILIIEDEAHLREEVASTLKYENFEVLEAENGNQGLKMAIEKKPNLILCDILMPGMDGYEVFNEIKKTLPAQIPFIFITALDKRTKRRQGMEMGADDFLIKPFTREELLNSVKARLKKTAEHQNQIRHIRECIVYSIPHEMRTPLSAILGLSEILTDEAAYLSKEEINEFGNSIFKSGKRLHEIIQKYLMFIDLEVHCKKVALKNIFLNQQKIEEIGEKIAKKYNRKNDLIVTWTPFSLQISEDWFYFALNELIDNAFKFSDTGLQVIIKGEALKTKIIISIQDKGTGFPEDYRKKINAFVQFDRKTREQQGIGLGLFLSKQIISLHQGEMYIQSHLEKGTNIQIVFPVKNINKHII